MHEQMAFGRGLTREKRLLQYPSKYGPVPDKADGSDNLFIFTAYFLCTLRLFKLKTK